MRILFNSKLSQFKEPFGTLLPQQNCTLRIHIPSQLQTEKVECRFSGPDGEKMLTVPMTIDGKIGAYDIFRGDFSFGQPGLFFYYFYITTPTGSFRLFKFGDDTNMEDGSMWQVSCIPADFSVPEWAMGATMYQIFPDRFSKTGEVDLSGKLQPYTVHEKWDEEVHWQPDDKGVILNNDFYGGNFRGIRDKMDYIASLGVTVLYLNPISKSFSNHRYDTGDYKTPDPMLGTLADFTEMCDAAHQRGIRVILDGVFSHTGSDSLYFDRNKNFGGNGAYNSKSSPYYSWYQFKSWPDDYNSWWGFDTLPTVNKLDPAFVEYIITGQDSVIAHWLRAGCDGFRLDVADELPTEFLSILKQHLRKLRPDALLLGEVWEDASNKRAYDVSRRYFVDGQLDSVMNYPFRTAILNFMRQKDDGKALADTVMTIQENYPPQVFLANMNLLSTHDSMRILTALVDDFDGTRAEKAARHLSMQQYQAARQMLLMASFLQYMLPGMPSLYYGDEAGQEGYKDPFNRRPYPWGQEDPILLEHFKQLGQLRKEQEVLRLGDLHFIEVGDGRLSFTRSFGSKTLRIYINRSDESWDVPGSTLLMGSGAEISAPTWLTLSPMGFCITED